MAYSELIKDFGRIRDYMRQFYVYGFKSRMDYTTKSARSYDNERRRIESWLGDYMSFRQDGAGKNVYLSVDSRSIASNPLYQAFKAKSFTNGDITFHFFVMDLLHDGEAYSAAEITELIASKYISQFDDADPLDESSIRKKLKEYTELGLLVCEKRGRENVYRRSAEEIPLDSWRDAIDFFSEADPLGVIGSFLQDRIPSESEETAFRFKHHYILHALDSQILADILSAMQENRAIEICVVSHRGSKEPKNHTIYPSKVYVSTQSGRQYLLCYHYQFKKPMFFRIDGIQSVKAGAVESSPKYAEYCAKYREHLWGVSPGIGFNIDHIEMDVHVGDGEGYIIDRLEREKRCGRVEVIDGHTYRFSADVYDASEMLPWLRTFIGRIVRLDCSNKFVVDRFYEDLDDMLRLYGGETDAVQ